MLKIKRFKGVIISLLAAAMLLVCFISVYAFQGQSETKNQNTNVDAASWYDIGTTTKTVNEAVNDLYEFAYVGYTYFNIKTENDLVALSQFIYNHSSYFTSKIVRLTKDLDFISFNSGASGYFPTLLKFGGIFDGQGYTISNCFNSYSADNVIGTLCTELITGGKIQNLKVYNSARRVESSWFGDSSYVGIICGSVASGAQIDSCIIENVYITTNRNKENCNIGVITGYNNGTISNCIVSGDIKVMADGSDDGANCYAFVANQANQIQNCLYRGTMTYSGEEENFNLNITMPDNSGCMAIANKPSGWDCSTQGGMQTGEDPVWYYGGTSWNNGYPMLRVFIKEWICATLSSDDSCTLNEDIIYFPYTQDYVLEVNGSRGYKFITRPSPVSYTRSTLNTIYAYELQITANAGYNSSSLTCVISPSYKIEGTASSVTYTFICWDIYITLEPSECTVQFMQTDNYVIPQVEPQQSTISPTFTVYYGTEIKVNYDSGNGPLSLQYTFKDVDNIDITITYEIGDGFKLENTNHPSVVTENSTIKPTIGQKQHTICFDIQYNDDDAMSVGSVSFEYGTYTDIYWDEYELKFSWKQNKTTYDYTYEVDAEKYIYDTLTGYDNKGNSYGMFGGLFKYENTYLTVESLNCNLTITVKFVSVSTVTFLNAEGADLNAYQNPVLINPDKIIYIDSSSYTNSLRYYYYSNNLSQIEIARYTLHDNYEIQFTYYGENVDFITLENNKSCIVQPSFKKIVFTLTFSDISLEDGSKIEPNGSDNEFVFGKNNEVYLRVDDNFVGQEGSCTLKYLFAGKYVTYSIPNGYRITNLGYSGGVVEITEDITIQPTVELIKYTVTFKEADKGCDAPEQEFVVNASDLPYLKFTCNKTSCSFIIETYDVTENESANVFEKTYTAESGFVFDYALIDNDRYGYLHNFSVKDDMEIQPYFLQLFTIMFTNSEGANLDGGKDSVPVTVKEGSEITASTSTHVPGQESTVTYNINDNYGNVLEQVSYTIEKRYIVTKTNAIASVSEDATISPVCQLAYFILKFANAEGTESEDVISPNLTEEFAVEIGTSEVQLSASPNTEQNGPFKLVYTFGGNSVEYEIPKEYKLVDLGKVGEIKEDTVITPVVKYITYEVVFAAVDGSEEIEKNINVAYGATLLFGLDYQNKIETYCAVRIIDDLGVNFYKQYNAIYSQTVGEDKWVINKITFKFEDGTELVDEAEEGKLVYNGAGDSELGDISITSNLTIKPEFIRMWDITFESGKGTTLEGGDKKTITVKDGQSITAVAPGYVVGKTSTMKYKVEDNLDVATYTIEKHYKVANTKSIEAVHNHTTIIPECSLHSREVKFVNNHSDIASILDSNSLLDSNYSMFVDYDTIVSFSVSTQNGVLCYNYKFEYDGKNLGTVTFVMINNKYAMLFEGEDRSKLINGLNSEDSYEFSAYDTSGVTIIPEFARKIYNVEVS